MSDLQPGHPGNVAPGGLDAPGAGFRLDHATAALAALSEGVVVQVASGEIVSCNPAAERILGLTRDQMAGRTSLDILWRAIHEDGSPFPDETHPAMVTLRTGEAVRGVVMGVQTPERSVRWISINSEPIPAPDGKPVSVVTTFTDITPRKLADEAARGGVLLLRRQAEEVRALMNVVPSAVYVSHDPECRVITGNLAANQLFGAGEEENVSAGTIHGENRNAARRFFREGRELGAEELPMQVAASTGRDVTGFEMDFVSPSGEERTLLGNASPLLGADGTVQGSVAAFLEITDRKKAAEALRESEEKFRGVIENLQDAYFHADRAGRFVLASPSAARMFGFGSVEEMIGTLAVGVYMQPEERDRLLKDLQATGRIYDREVEARRRDGSGFWVSMNVQFVRDKGGCIVGTEGVVRDITERKRAEEALRESEEKYRRIIETTHDGVWMIDAESRTTFVNRRMAEMLGFSPEEMLGQPIFRFMTDDARATAERNVERRKKGIAEEHDFCFQRKDGSEVWTMLGTTPLFAPDGAYTGALATVTDITERKKVEETLRASAETHRSILQTAMDGFWLADSKGRFLEVNEAYVRISGYSEPELLSLRISDVEANEKAEDTAAHLQALMTLGHDRFETRHRRKDGTVFEVEISTQYKPIEEGRVVAFLRDLTDQKLAEAEIERLLRLHTALIELNEALVRVRSRDELFREVPRIVVERGGFKMAWMGWHDTETHRIDVITSHGDETGYLEGICVFADERPEGMGPTGTAVREGRAVVVNDFLADRRTLPWREKAHRAGWRSSAAFPVRQAGEARGVLTVYAKGVDFFGDREVVLLEQAAADISFALDSLDHEMQRKRAEAEIRQLNAGLEQRVLERTAELEAANKELEAFSFSVSHDLRAPLRAIEGFSEMLVKDSSERLNPEDQRCVDVIRTNARRMSALIGDLLRFSRVSRSEMRRGSIDMTRMAKELVGEIVPDAQGNRFEIRVDELPPASGDPALVRVVLGNLLSNAVKYSAKREPPVIEVGFRPGPGGPEYFVKDNGVGFSMKYAGKLFGVFQRLHDAREFEGTGIGLALVKRVVEKHGGTVRAEGAVGEGATFYFTLGPATAARRDQQRRASLNP